MIDVNNVTLSGRFTSDGEMKRASNDKEYLVIDLAMSEVDTTKDRSLPLNQRIKTTYIHCLAFGKTGEYIHQKQLKGKRVVLKGHLSVNKRLKKGLNFQFENTHLVIEDYMVFSMNEGKKENPAPPMPVEMEA